MHVWYDKWTPGDSGDNIHIIVDGYDNDDVDYWVFDTSTDTPTGPAQVRNGSGAYNSPNMAGTVTKSTDGFLFSAVADAGPNTYFDKCESTCTTGSNWSAINPGYTWMNDGDDHAQLLPLTDGDILAIYHDTSAGTIYSFRWDEATDAWEAEGNAVTILTGTGFVDYYAPWGAIQREGEQDVYLAVNNQINNAAADLVVYKYTASSNTWALQGTIYSNIGTANMDVKLVANSNIGDMYAVYSRGTWESAVSIYYKLSTDDGANWGTETALSTTTADDWRTISTNFRSDERLYAVWFDDDDNDIYGALVADLTPPDPTTSLITASPTSVAADGVTNSTITLQLKDSGSTNLTFGGHTVELFTDLGSLSSVTDVGDGTYTATLNHTVTGVATITGTVTGQAITDNATVTFVPGPLDHFVVEGAGGGAIGTQTAGTSFNIQITAEDANNNTVTLFDGAGNTADITSTGTLSAGGGATATFSSGVLASHSVTISNTGSFTITATDSAGGLGSGTENGVTNSFTVDPGPADETTSLISAAPTSIPANGVGTSTITVQLKDANGNNLDSGGDTVTIATDLGSLSGTVTDVGDGTYTETLTAGLITGTATISGTVNGPAITDTEAVTLATPVTDAANSTVSSSPASVPANGVTTSTITVTLRDADNVPLVTHNVTLAQGGGSSVISPGTAVSNVAGVATFTVTNTTVENVTYTATDTTDTIVITDTADVNFITPVTDAGTSTVDSSPASVPADGSTTSTITVTLLDVGGQPISGNTVTLAQGGGSSVITPGSANSNGSGVATFTVTNNTAEVVTYTATDTTDSVVITDTADVAFSSLAVADAGTSTVTSSPGSVLANGVSSSTITVTVRDVSSTPLAGKTVTLGQGAGSSNIAPASAISNGSGVATFTVTNTTAEGVTYTATVTTDSVVITQTAAVTFNTPVTNAGTSTVSASPGSVSANGVASSTITVTLRDADSVAMASHNVTLAQGAGSSTIVPGTAVSNASGVATFTVKNSTVENVTYTATDTTDTIVVTQTDQVNFTAPVTNAANSTVSASPATVLANGVSSSTITVTLLDADSVVVAGHNVTLAQGAGSSTILPGTAVSNVSGVATFTVTNTTAEAVTYTATDTTDTVVITETDQVTFNAALTNAGLSTVVAIPTTVASDGVSSATITVTLRDADSVPVSGNTVSLGQGGGSSNIVPASTATNGSGVATFTVTNTTVEAVTYTATDTTDSVVVTQTAQVTFAAAFVDLQQIHVRWRNDDGVEGTFDGGSGGDGAVTINSSQNINTQVLGSLRSTNADGILTTVSSFASATGGTDLDVASATGFANGDEILVINLQGDGTNNGNVGNYEFLEIQNISSNTFTFTSTIEKLYGATTSNLVLTGQQVIVQRVPQWTSVTIQSGGTLIANAWDGTSGGIIAFRANGTVNVQSGGFIDANGLGYTGGGGSDLDGGSNGESYDGSVGKGGNDTTSGANGGNFGTSGGGGSSNAGTTPSPAGTRGGGGGGGGDNTNPGAGGSGGTTDVAGGGGGSSGDNVVGGAGGNAGSAGGGTATLAAVGSGATTGQGGHGGATGNTGLGAGGGGGGGLYGTASLTTLFHGSGGGGGGGKDNGTTSGTGGGGGGIIFVAADTVTNSGTIRSNGANGTATTDARGASGAGAGGSILVHANTFTNSSTFTATGGTGGSDSGSSTVPGGGGGDGGDGRIRIEDTSPTLGTITPTASTANTPLTVAGGTYAANEDTLLPLLAKTTLKRLRFEISNEGTSSSASIQYRLEVSEHNPASCPGASSYTAVPTASTGHWQIVGSANFTDGDATHNIVPGLTNENTDFVSGESKDTGNQTSGNTLAATEFTEIEYAVQATNNAKTGVLYCFRLTNAGSTTDFTYVEYAQATVDGVDNFLVETEGGGPIGTQTAGNSFNVRITGRDFLNVTVASFSGTVDITSSSAISAGSGTTASFSSGVLSSHSVTLTTSGSQTITATLTAGTENGTSNSFTINPGAAATATTLISASPTSILANGVSTSTITVQAKDAYGNNLTSGGDTVTLATDLGNLSGTVTDVGNGTYTETLTSVTTAGNATVSGTINGPTITDTAVVVFTPGAPSKVVITVVGSDFTTDGSTNLTVQVQDAANNLITGDFSTVITFDPTLSGTISGVVTGSGDGSYGVVGGAENVTVAGGVATVTLVDTLVETFEVAITNDGGLSNPANDSINVTHGALDHFVVEAQGGGAIGTQTAGVGFNIQVIAEDANNNTITSFNGAGQTAVISSTGTLSAGGGTTLSFTNGVLSNHSVTVTSATSVTITATDSPGGLGTGSENGVSNSFTVDPGSLDHFLVEAAGGGAIPTQTAAVAFNIQITAQDPYDNTVPLFTGAGNTVEISSTGTLSAGSGTTATFTNGVLASHSVTITNTGSFTITATDSAGGQGTGTETGVSNSFTVDPGPLDHFLVEAVGGGAIGTQTAAVAFNIQITAEDANNNTATQFDGAGNTAEISSTGTLSAGNGTTATFTNGVLASHGVTISNTGSFTITATDSAGGLGGGTETGVSNSFTVNPGALDHFLVEAVGGGAIGTQTAGSGFNIQITAQDAGNNTMTAFDGAGNTAEISSTGTLSAGNGTTATFTNGVLASHSVTITNTGSFTITATDSAGGLGTGTETGVSNSFTVDPGPLDHFLVEAVGGGAIATQGAGVAFNIQITAQDSNTNTVTPFDGAGNTAEISSTGTLSAGNGTTATFTNGVLASHSVTITNTGNFTITATDSAGGLGTGTETGVSNSFTVDPGPLDHFLVEAVGGGVIGTQTAGAAFNIQITAQDTNNNTTTAFDGAGNTAEISSTGTLSAGSGTTATFTNGVLASHSVTITNTGSFTITATDSVGGEGSGTETGVSNSFTVDPGAVDHFVVEAAGGGVIPTQVAGIAFNIQITAEDANNNTMTLFDGAANTVEISSTGTLSAGGGTTATFSNGVLASHSVTITNTGNFTITATDSAGGLGTGTETGVSNSFAIDTGPLDHFLVEAMGGGAIGSQLAGTGFNIQITAQDSVNNTVTTFTGAGNTAEITSTGTLSAGGGTTATFTNGVLAPHSVTITNTGSFTITATDSAGGAGTGIETGVSNAFTVDPGPLDHFLVEAAGGGAIGTQTAGVAFNIQITARDAGNNTVTPFDSAGNTVDISSTGTLSAGSGATATFTNAVLASHSVTITNTGSFTITATDSAGGLGTGTESGVSSSFTVDPGPLDHFLVEAVGGGAIGTQTAGTGFNIQITAQDANNNTVVLFDGATNTAEISSTGTLSAGSGTTATFTNGVLAAHSVTITDTGSFTITATDSAGGLGSGSETGVSNSFTVDPGPVNHFLVDAVGGAP